MRPDSRIGRILRNHVPSTAYTCRVTPLCINCLANTTGTAIRWLAVSDFCRCLRRRICSRQCGNPGNLGISTKCLGNFGCHLQLPRQSGDIISNLPRQSADCLGNLGISPNCLGNLGISSLNCLGNLGYQVLQISGDFISKLPWQSEDIIPRLPRQFGDDIPKLPRQSEDDTPRLPRQFRDDIPRLPRQFGDFPRMSRQSADCLGNLGFPDCLRQSADCLDYTSLA